MKYEILTMHVLLRLIFNERVSSWFLLLGVLDNADAFNVSVLLKLSLQFAFACVEIDSSNKQRLEGVPDVPLRVPHSDLLLELVGHLLSLLLLPPLPPLLPALHLDRGGSVHRVLEQVDVLGDTLVEGSLFCFKIKPIFLKRQF